MPLGGRIQPVEGRWTQLGCAGLRGWGRSGSIKDGSIGMILWGCATVWSLDRKDFIRL